MQNKNELPGTETTLVTAGQTMSVLEQEALMMTAWNRPVGTEKNAEEEIEMHILGNGPGNPHLLTEEAQTEE